MRLWFFDHLADWSERFGDFLSAPWHRISAWSASRWRQEHSR